MSENDFKEGTDTVKPRRKPRPAVPLFVPGAIYLREEIKEALCVSEDTFAKWKEAGLPIRKPGTAHAVIFADDLFALFHRLTDEEQIE